MIANKRSIEKFVKKWTAPGTGHEESDTQSFWEDLLEDVLGIEHARSLLSFEYPVAGYSLEHDTFIDRNADVLYPNMHVLIEQKSRGVNLDKRGKRSKLTGEETPYEQAKWYADNLPKSLQPRWIIVSNFDEIRIHDLERNRPAIDFETLMLEDLPREANRLGFMVDEKDSVTTKERHLSVQAGEKVANLYHYLETRYENIKEDLFEQHSLNILITRLVFIMFAEDAGLLPKDLLWHYLSDVPTEHINGDLARLFDVLDTPKEERDHYLPQLLKTLPYVDGGLFDKSIHIAIPPFDVQCRLALVEEASRSLDWSDVSPTIFGATFESTLNPETRRYGGMHYTSIQNIHRALEPLFLRELRSELTEAIAIDVPRERITALKDFWERLASIRVLDPACGSGNFLTECYLELRKMENEVLAQLKSLDALDTHENPVRVSIEQLYGIEINDFAVSVARTALWIAERQMMEETQELIGIGPVSYFPLSRSENIVCADALAIDWNDVIPAGECDYVVGNPPFSGGRMMSSEQKAGLRTVFGKAKGVGDLDFVAAWFLKGAKYGRKGHTKIAFVATNSITQGIQVAPIWKPISSMGYSIDFCHDTFKWDNEAVEKAAVFCCIIGYSRGYEGNKTIYHHENPTAKAVATNAQHINGYLRDEPDLLVWDRETPLCDVPRMRIGNKPIDGGHFILTKKELNELEFLEPKALNYVHPFIGAEEFLHNKKRWILWLGDTTEDELLDLPYCRERINAVRDYRLNSKSAGTRKLGLTPTHYHVETIPSGPSIIIPEVSSERREYVPIGFVNPETFCSNLVRLITGANIYQFGILQSSVHNVWLRAIGGRLKSDYRYSIGLVYNNFVWPATLTSTRASIESAAQRILDVRANFPTRDLATLYDPDKMPETLRAAHQELDRAVNLAYGFEADANEAAVRLALEELYMRKTRNEG